MTAAGTCAALALVLAAARADAAEGPAPRLEVVGARAETGPREPSRLHVDARVVRVEASGTPAIALSTFARVR